MSEKALSKIDIKVGSISFAAEGDQDWLSAQLERVLNAAKTGGAISAAAPAAGGADTKSPIQGKFSTSLSSYIKQKGAEKNQTLRFLATADWLRQRGAEQLTSGAVAKALLENQQSRLANPADCLNKNVSKGLCEKAGKAFFITPEGLKELGHD